MNPLLAAFAPCLDDDSLRALHLHAYGDALRVRAYVDPPAPQGLIDALDAGAAALLPAIPGATRISVGVDPDARRIRGGRSSSEIARIEPDVGPWLARRLVRDGLVPPDHPLEGRADRAAIELGLATEAQVTACVARLHRLPVVDLAPLSPGDVSRAVSFPLLRRLHTVLLPSGEGHVAVLDDPSGARALDDLTFVLGAPPSLTVASWSAVERLLNPAFRADGRCRFCGDPAGIYDGACEGCANPYLGVVW